MSDDDLRETVESLKARVSRLEEKVEQDDENPTPTPTNARAARLDHYDKPVVNSLERHETYHVRELTQRYLKHSRISERSTAKERVKQLVKSDGFTPRGAGDHEFTGWGE